MTHNIPTTAAGEPNPGDPLNLATLVANGTIDAVPGDPMVPVTVFRLADIDSATISDAGTAASFAELLLALYTHLGDTVVSLDHDPTLAGVCGGNGRRFVHATHVARRDDVFDRLTEVALIMVRWPGDRGGIDNDTELTDLFHACRRVLRADGKVVVAITGPGNDADLYIRQARHLMPAAYAAGLGYFQRLITVIAPIHGERPARHACIADPAVLRRATHIAVHGDTVAFTIRPSRGRRA